MNPIARILIKIIEFYQKNISPRKISCCRFTPTCSAYAIEAIRLHGCLKGTGLAVWRLLRCHPLCRGGYDPVPQPRSNRKNNL